MPRPRPAALGALASLAAIAIGCTTSGGTSLSANRSTIPSSTTTAAPRGNVDGALRIGALLPFTGEGASIGASLLAGVELAIDQINRAGGVNRQPVVLVKADDGSEPTTAAVALERLVQQDRVDAIIGPASTRVTRSLLEPITDAGVLACSPTNTAISISEFPDDDYYFRTAPPDSLQAVALGRAIAETGRRSTAILYVDDEYGQSVADALATELRRQGSEVVANVAIDPTAPDFQALLLGVLDQDPAAIAYAGVPDPGVRIISTLRELGVRPERVPIFVSDGMRVPDLPARVSAIEPGAVAGVLGTSMAPELSSNGWFRDALAAFDAKAANVYAAYAYDCTNLIALAAQSIASDDPAALRTAMLDVSKGGSPCRDFPTCAELLNEGRIIDLDGASGPIEFQPNGDPEWGTFDLFRFDEAGREMAERQIPVRAG